MSTRVIERYYEYGSLAIKDTAHRKEGPNNATVMVYSGNHCLALTGDKARFAELRDLLDHLVRDWD